MNGLKKDFPCLLAFVYFRLGKGRKRERESESISELFVLLHAVHSFSDDVIEAFFLLLLLLFINEAAY